MPGLCNSLVNFFRNRCETFVHVTCCAGQPILNAQRISRPVDPVDPSPGVWRMCYTAPMGRRKKKPIRSQSQIDGLPEPGREGLGPGAGGQSGDIQGLSNLSDADSESVEELVEEGQAFEAEVISGVEDAPNPDTEEIKTKEVSEDDVPPEYQGRD
jgi:hypothetical protein